jgi:hypothetical protein
LTVDHPEGQVLVAQATERGIPVGFVDAGPLPADRVVRLLHRAGYAQAALFSSVAAAQQALGGTRLRHLQGEPRDLEPSGLSEVESLCQGLLRRYDLRADVSPAADNAAESAASRRIGYAILGPLEAAGADRLQALERWRVQSLPAQAAPDLEAGARAFAEDFARAQAHFPWLTLDARAVATRAPVVVAPPSA